MSKENLFDGISRILASGMSRRRAFRLIAGALTSGAASFLGPQKASAQSGYVAACCIGSGCATGNITAKQCTAAGGSPAPSCSACTATVNCCVAGICYTNAKLSDCQSHQGTVVSDCSMCKSNTASVVVAAVQPGPPMRLALTAQDSTYGIANISVSEAVNCNITPTLPMTAGGTTSAIALAATKVSHYKPARITLAVTDPYGDIENKHILFTVLKLSTGSWVKQTFSDLLPGQAHLTLTNGSFGFTKLEVWVNSKLQRTLGLTNNQTLTLDLYAEMTESKNTISLVGFGKTSASANIMLMDEAPDPNSKLGTESTDEFTPGMNIWGPLAEVVEDNSDLQLASVSTQTIQLTLDDSLSGGTNLAPSFFTVEVDAKSVVVESVAAHAGANGTTGLTLQLPSGTLSVNDTVDVAWQKLPDASGRTLSGFAQLSAQ